MKIVIFELGPNEESAFDALRSQHDVTLIPEPLTAANAASFRDAEIISTFIYSKLDRAALEPLSSLKLIATRSTGYDHIALDFCTSQGIGVVNVPTYGDNTVAEHVFALLLTISHRIPEAMERARTGLFSPEGLEGFDLMDKTLGVIGTGNIGRHVARIALGFQMKVIAYDVRPDPAFASDLGFTYVALDRLFAESDIITLHVPSSPETRHLLSSDAFKRMKKGVVVINTARGDIIDTVALIEAIGQGTVASAGLDVLPDEPLIREEAELISPSFFREHNVQSLLANHVLLRMRKVVVTPHSAFNTREATQRISSTTVDNILNFVAGRPSNLVVLPGGER